MVGANAASKQIHNISILQQVEELLGLIEQRAAASEALRGATAACPDVCLRFLQPGRLVKIAAGPPSPGRPLPQLGPVPKGAGLGEGDEDGGGGGSEEGGEEGGDVKEEGQQQQQQAASIGDILRRVDG